MSRIGKAPINIPAGVTVTIKDNTVTVKGQLMGALPILDIVYCLFID